MNWSERRATASRKPAGILVVRTQRAPGQRLGAVTLGLICHAFVEASDMVPSCTELSIARCICCCSEGPSVCRGSRLNSQPRTGHPRVQSPSADTGNVRRALLEHTATSHHQWSSLDEFSRVRCRHSGSVKTRGTGIRGAVFGRRGQSHQLVEDRYPCSATLILVASGRRRHP